MWIRSIIFFCTLGMLFLLTPASFADSEIAVFGPEKFTRTTGAPDIFVRTFSVTTAVTDCRIVVENGDQASNRLSVSSAVITLNGTEVVSPSDLNKQVALIERPVTVAASNELTTELRSGPGAFIVVSVLCTQLNAPPVAEAGMDSNALTSIPLRLDGSGSYDPDGDLITFHWTLVSAPPGSAASLNDATRPDPRFVPDVSGNYIYELVVNDGQIDSIADSVTISASFGYAPPNALAGPDKNALVNTAVTLDGSGSNDPNGFPLNYSWSLTAKPADSGRDDADIVGRDQPVSQFSPDKPGTYTLNLAVDNGSDMDTDTVQVFASAPNVAPNADAGADRAVKVGVSAELNGAGSADPDGGPAPLAFNWSLIGRPPGSIQDSGDIANASAATAQFAPATEGSYVARLDVDDSDKSDADNVLVVADDTPPSIEFLNPADGATIDTTTPRFDVIYSDQGSGLDLNTYRTFVNGIDVTAGTEVNPTGATYTAGSPLPAGDNEATATIADRAGNVQTASTRFTIDVFRAIADCAPTSGSVPLSVRFRSRGEFTGGSIVRYRWDFEGDGSFNTSDSVARDYTRTFNQQGTFVAVLEVTNNLGETAIDTCTIQVGGNAPTASANATPSNGPIPLDVNFTCTGSDTDGTIALYEWDFEGDGVFDVSSPTSGSVSHTYTQEGTFIAVCRVTDNDGLSAEARTTTTVIRPAPPGSPSVQATASPTSGNAPLGVSFNGSATDDGALVQWEWDFEGDGVYDYSSPTTPATNFTYTSAGIFAAALRVTDDEGKIGIDTVEVIVNLNASLSIPDDTFDPTLGETASVDTTLTAGVPVRILLKNQAGAVVRTLVDEFRTAGSYSDAWDGRDDSGRRLPQAPYYAVLEYDFGGAVRTVDLTNTTGGTRYNPSRTGIPSRFSPLAGQPLVIDFTIPANRGASEVTAFIGRFNVDTRLVTFMERVPFGVGTHRLTWNGENADGQLFHPPPGDRFLFGIFGYTLPDNALFVRSGAHISGFALTPSIFDPTGHIDDQGTPERSALTFTLSNPADVELTVDDAETGERSARLIYPGLAAGANTIDWNGRNENGVLVAPGRYRLGVAAIDSTGYRSIRIYLLQRVYY